MAPGLVPRIFPSDYQGFKRRWGGSTNGRFDRAQPFMEWRALLGLVHWYD